MITKGKNKLEHDAIELAKKIKAANPELFEDDKIFYKCSPAVIYDHTLSGREKLLYRVVSNLAQAYGVCFASQTTIGRLTGFEERTNVVRALQRLESKLFLKSVRMDFRQKIYLIISSHIRYPFLNDLDASGKRKKKNSFEYLMSEQYRQDIDAYLSVKSQKNIQNSHFLNSDVLPEAQGDVSLITYFKGDVSLTAHQSISLTTHGSDRLTTHGSDRLATHKEEIDYEEKIKEEKEKIRTGSSDFFDKQSSIVFKARKKTKLSNTNLKTKINCTAAAQGKRNSSYGEYSLVLAERSGALDDTLDNNNAIQEDEMVSKKEIEALDNKAREFTASSHAKKLAKEMVKENDIGAIKSGMQVIASRPKKRAEKDNEEKIKEKNSLDLFNFYKAKIFNEKGYVVGYSTDIKTLSILKRSIAQFGFEQLQDLIAWALENWKAIGAKDYRFKNLTPTLETLMKSSNIEALLMIKAEMKPTLHCVGKSGKKSILDMSDF
jgi:hypothetical protein